MIFFNCVITNKNPSLHEYMKKINLFRKVEHLYAARFRTRKVIIYDVSAVTNFMKSSHTEPEIK